MDAGNQLLVIIGGSRGLAKALAETFYKNNFEILCFSRKSPEFRSIHKMFDIFDIEALVNCRSSILDLYLSKKYKSISLQYLPGGSMGNSAESLDLSIEQVNRLIHYNFTGHYFISSWLVSECKKLIDKQTLGRMHFNYYFTGAQDNLMSHPLYASGKQALITTMKHFVKQNIRNLSFSGFKLGCMDINHKYMHKLRLEDNDKFNNILNEEVPSGHFTKPEEVAQWVLDSHCNPHLSNGMIADISGGNSWI